MKHKPGKYMLNLNSKVNSPKFSTEADITRRNYLIAMDEILMLKNVIAEARYYLTILDPNKDIHGHISYLHTMLNNSLQPNAKADRPASAGPV